MPGSCRRASRRVLLVRRLTSPPHSPLQRIQEDDTFLPGRQLELGAEFIHGDINGVVELCEANGWSRRQIFTWSHGDGGPAEGPAPDGGVGYSYMGKEGRLLRYDDDDADMKVCNEALWKLSAVESAAAEADTRTLRQYLVDEGVPTRMLGLADAGYGNTAGGTMDTVPVTRAMRYERAWHGDGSDLDPDFRMEPSFSVLVTHLARNLDISCSSPVASISVDVALKAASSAALQAHMAARGADESEPSNPSKAVPVTEDVPDAPAPACTVVTRGGVVLRAHRVVVCVPLPVLKDEDIKFSPPLSAAKVAAAKSMSFANGVKIVLKFNRAAWPANCHGTVCADSLIPEMWMNSSVGVGGLINGQHCQFTAGEAASWADEGGDPEAASTGGASSGLAHAGDGKRSVTTDRGSLSGSSYGGGGASTYTEPIPEPEPGVFHIVTGYIMGVRADALLASFDQPTIVTRFLAQIDAMYGMDATGAFLSGFVHNWADEEFIRGAYSTPTFGEANDVARKLKETHLDAVFFAGEATAGTIEGELRDTPENRTHFAPPIVMHGAFQTGGRAACEVASSLGCDTSRCACAKHDKVWTPSYSYLPDLPEEAEHEEARNPSPAASATTA